MKSLARKIHTVSCLALLLGVSQTALAEVGPGLGNLDCGDAEYFKPFSFIENDSGPKGTNVSIIIRGYFMTIFTPDSGAAPGEIAVYDLSNPKAPNRVKLFENTPETNIIREAHSLPVAIIDGKYYVAIQSTKGIQFWDFTDPPNAKRIGNIDLPGVNGGDYENVAWQTSWQGHHLYVSGGNQGIYVIDAGDPTNPKLLKQVSTSTTGAFRVGPLFALGDYLVISNMDQGGAYSVLDISLPDAPALLSTVRDLPRMYAIVVGHNDRIYSAGRDGNFLNHSFEDPRKLVEVKNAMIGQDQLYAAVQDDHVFLGRQNNVVKVDMNDEMNPKVIGEGTLGRGNPDHGQVTPMGNLIFIGNDHGTGSALFCHQRGQDTRAPTIHTTFPKDGSTGISTSSRIGILFSDYIDTETIKEENIVVRPSGGEPLAGIFSYAFNTLSFGPDEEFEVDTTYEVVLSAGGITDVMGNALEEETILRFSTGDSVVIVEPPLPEPEPGSGGADSGGTGSGGAIASSGGATGSASGGAANSATGGNVGAGGNAFGAGGAATASGGSGDNLNPSNDGQQQGGCAVSPGPNRTTTGLGILALALLAFRRRLNRA